MARLVSSSAPAYSFLKNPSTGSPPSKSLSSSSAPSFFLSSLSLGLDLEERSEATLSQSLGPDFEEVGYDGPGASSFVEMMEEVVVLALVFVAKGDPVPSKVDHLLPGSLLRRTTSILVERTRKVDDEDSTAAYSGSNDSEKDDVGSAGCGKAIESCEGSQVSRCQVVEQNGWHVLSHLEYLYQLCPWVRP